MHDGIYYQRYSSFVLYWQYCGASICTYVAMRLSRTNYWVLKCYILRLANDASNHRHIHVAFLTSNWKTVSSNVTSFLAPNSDFHSKWKSSIILSAMCLLLLPQSLIWRCEIFNTTKAHSCSLWAAIWQHCFRPEIWYFWNWINHQPCILFEMISSPRLNI